MVELAFCRVIVVVPLLPCEANGELCSSSCEPPRLDGVPIGSLRLETLRGALGYVPQDGFLFSETYRENLLFGADEPLPDERLEELVVRYEADHPGVAGAMRQLIDALAKAGI